MTFEEEKAIEELRRRMSGKMGKDMLEDTSMFERFIRARNFNINAAENMLKNHIEWRKANQVDTILTDYTQKEAIKKYMTMDRICFDKEGSPVLLFRIGNLDTRGLSRSCRKSDIVKSIVQRLESSVLTMKEQSAKRGKKVDKWIQIHCFENLSLATATHKPTLEIIGSMISMYEANYPERLKAAYFINASIYFSIAFSFLKPFLSGPTFKKITIFGKDGWKEELLKHIDADVLPAFLGGNLTDPDGDPMCRTLVTHGGLIPECYYFNNKKHKSLSKSPGVKKLQISRMSKMSVKLLVPEPGDCIEWEFETKNGDIGFSLLYTADNNEESEAKELIPKQRIDTIICSETGMYHCEKPGTYIIEFDNTYSWMHHKEVYYKATVASNRQGNVKIME